MGGKKAGRARGAGGTGSAALRLTAARLDEMIWQATPDCEGRAEMVSGLFEMILERVAFPFEAKVRGRAVAVEGVETTARDVIVAVCRRREGVEEISILDVTLPTPPPPGAEWIEAYRRLVERGSTTRP